MILRKPYTRSVDLWALGIVLYEMLVGHVPFIGATRNDTYEKIVKGDIKWSIRVPNGHVKDLIRGLLGKSNSKRLGGKGGVAEVMEQPWFAGIDWDAVETARSVPPFAPRLIDSTSEEWSPDDDELYVDFTLQDSPGDLGDEYGELFAEF